MGGWGTGVGWGGVGGNKGIDKGRDFFFTAQACLPVGPSHQRRDVFTVR